jgi:polysaccharide export outer membrane protein
VRSKQPLQLRHFFSPFYLAFCLLIGSLLSSCASYKQNIMFKATDQQAVKGHVTAAEKNYTIQKNDLLSLEVYTNQGERLIDPEAFLQRDRPNASMADTPRTYLVDTNGKTKFPLLQEINLEGLTIRQGEAILQKEYAKFYQEPYVILKYANKRVTVLGAPGGQVIPLTNENVRLTEVLALAKGISNDAKAYNIRVIRGDTLFIADLSTFEGYTKSNLLIEPGDIIYVEPIRRPFSEGLRDYGPLVSIITSISTIIIIIVRL